MFTAVEGGFIFALLVSCLIALMLVLVARREARAVREQANADAKELRDHLKNRSLDVDARMSLVREAEQAVAGDRRALRKLRLQIRRHEAVLSRREAALTAETEAAQQRIRTELEAISGLSEQEALARLETSLLDEARHRVAQASRALEARASQSAQQRAHEILADALQRLAVPVSSSVPVTVVALPSEDMRGRIIGKEGRNIHTFEALTGVDVLVEDGSSTVVLSCFDPGRRDVAAVALESLIADGRIHPSRIERAVAEARQGQAGRVRAAGRAAAESTGNGTLPDAITETLGALATRASYGQDVLAHSVETAQIAAQLAFELGADASVASRAGLLHDIGKAFTSDAPGSHALLGAQFLRRNGESAAVVSAIAAHHDEQPHESIESVLVQIADACSSARPGARRQDVGHYIERMSRLEALVAAVPGVSRVLVMSAGREVRVVVEPASVSDEALPEVADVIARLIDAEGKQPGGVTITVVRELRAVATSGQGPSPES